METNEAVTKETPPSHVETVSTEKPPTCANFYGEYLSEQALLAARQTERKLKWKIDLIILPLLSTVYFLAQMVCRVDWHNKMPLALC